MPLKHPKEFIRIPGRLPVYGTLVELGILAGRGVDRVDVDDGHLLVQNFGTGLDQFPGFAVQAGALKKQSCGARETGKKNKKFSKKKALASKRREGIL